MRLFPSNQFKGNKAVANNPRKSRKNRRKSKS